MVRRKNRRQPGTSTPQGSRPAFLGIIGDGLSGPATTLDLVFLPEGDPTDVPLPYLGALNLMADVPLIVTSEDEYLVSMSFDNTGPGGATVLNLVFDVPPATDEIIYFPSNMAQIRGQNGEWLAAGSYRIGR